MQPLCVYCVCREATTYDHVPPKVFFPKPRPQLITVPACDECNHQFSTDDEEFASFLSLRVGMDSPLTKQLHEKNKRIVAHNRRILRTIQTSTAKVNFVIGPERSLPAYAVSASTKVTRAGSGLRVGRGGTFSFALRDG